MSGKRAKAIRKKMSYDKAEGDGILRRNYRRVKKIYTKLNTNLKTEYNQQ